MSEGQGGDRAAPGAGIGRLTEEEAKLVAKLLSDPTFFPIEFRTWLKQFIEGSGIIITASQVQGGQGTNISTGLPPGIILPCGAAAAVPADCILCDGAVRVRTDYPLLFNVIGTNWGAGDGSTTFNVPDLRDRALYGAGGRIGVAETDGVAFGSRGGPLHHHYLNQTSGAGGSHTHSVSGSISGTAAGVGDHQHLARDDGTPSAELPSAQTGATGTARYTGQNPRYYTGSAGAHSHSVSGSFSGSTDSQGSHSHNTSGDTSGGYLQDKSSYAGVIYVITIGTTAP